MTAPPPEVDVPRLVLVMEEIGTEEDICRIGRLTRCLDTAEDRAHLRLLIVRAQEEVAPGPPALLESTARTALASLRGRHLYRAPESRSPPSGD